MISRIKHSIQQLKDGRPGRRFLDHYHRNNIGKEQKPAWKSWLLIILGFFMFVAGFILSLPPGLPGFLLWIPGLALIASQIKFIAVTLDRLECSARNLYHKITGR